MLLIFVLFYVKSNRQLPSIVGFPPRVTGLAQESVQFSWDGWVWVGAYSEEVFSKAVSLLRKAQFGFREAGLMRSLLPDRFRPGVWPFPGTF